MLLPRLRFSEFPCWALGVLPPLGSVRLLFFLFKVVATRLASAVLGQQPQEHVRRNLWGGLFRLLSKPHGFKCINTRHGPTGRLGVSLFSFG